jgi:hypothetical protein
MPTGLTDVTEIVTALGMVAPTLDAALAQRPSQLVNVEDSVWDRVCRAHIDGHHAESFRTAFANGQAFLAATDGLRGATPLRIEWKGPHRPPGDDVIPADLRIDHVYLISCKYLSKVLLNAGPPRLFDRLLVGEDRSPLNWFTATAAGRFQALYDAAKTHTGLVDLPATPEELRGEQRRALKTALSARRWPEPLREPWLDLCADVADASARRWRAAMPSKRHQVRMLWRILRICTATYFVLGTDRAAHLRLRVDSAWDWLQAYELRTLTVTARPAGQPEVGWQAVIRRRSDGQELSVDGHVEIRWSHGRFVGTPEAKVYLDTPHTSIPGYNALT